MLLHVLADFGEPVTLQVLRELGNPAARVELIGEDLDLEEAVDFAATLLAMGRPAEASDVLDAAARAAMVPAMAGVS